MYTFSFFGYIFLILLFLLFSFIIWWKKLQINKIFTQILIKF